MHDIKGTEGDLSLSITDSEPGLVRLEIRGDNLELRALADGPIAKGERVVVMAVEHDTVRVARAEEVYRKRLDDKL